MYTHFNRNKKKYITWAAVLIMIVFVIPNISKLFGIDKVNFALMRFSGSKSASSATLNSAESLALDQSSSTASTAKGINTGEDFSDITFGRQELKGDEKIIPKDTWKQSADTKYSACIDGDKSIYVKENNTGKLWSFNLNSNSNLQNIPLFVEWSQKDEILMVIGKETATIDQGGDIYVLNKDSGVAKLIYKSAALEKIKDLKGINGGLSAEIIVYEDFDFKKYHMENITISSEHINNMMSNMSTLSREASIVFEYQENINNNRFEAAIKLISKKHIDSKAFNYNSLLYDIDNMNVTSLKKISSNYSTDPVTKISFQHEAFSAEVNYKLKKDGNNVIKSGKNKLVFVLVKDDIDSSWQIGEINVIK